MGVGSIWGDMKIHTRQVYWWLFGLLLSCHFNLSFAEERYWNRSESKEEVEAVYGEGALHWLYGTKPGLFLNRFVLSRTLPTWLCGAYQSSRVSRREIQPFIQKMNIDMDLF